MPDNQFTGVRDRGRASEASAQVAAVETVHSTEDSQERGGVLRGRKAAAAGGRTGSRRSAATADCRGYTDQRRSSSHRAQDRLHMPDRWSGGIGALIA